MIFFFSIVAETTKNEEKCHISNHFFYNKYSKKKKCFLSKFYKNNRIN